MLLEPPVRGDRDLANILVTKKKPFVTKKKPLVTE